MPAWTTSGPGAYWGIPTGTTEGTLATGTRKKPAWETDMEKALLDDYLKKHGLASLPEGVSFSVIS